MTAQDVIIASMRKLGIVASGETPSSDELTTGLDALNEMVNNWNDVLARTLAGSYAAALYTFVPLQTFGALSTTLTGSAGLQRALVYNLAVDIGPEFGRAVPPEVAAIAEKAKMAILTLPAPVL
jgi:predicted component of type VI protein secretion system